MQTSEIKEKYNKIVKDKFKRDYEYNRWFKDELSFSGYTMTKKSIEKHLLSRERRVDFILELGPGAGTWSKLLMNFFKNSFFDLVDISGEMLSLTKKNLGEERNLHFYEIDFLDFDSEKKYDLFFSSRVIEYFPDKEKVVDKIYSLLNKDGEGFIITKMPQYWRYNIFFKKVPIMHRGQIAPRKLNKILLKKSFKNIKFYPVTMSFPFFNLVFLNNFLFSFFYSRELNFFSQIFCESYCVKFIKK